MCNQITTFQIALVKMNEKCVNGRKTADSA